MSYGQEIPIFIAQAKLTCDFSPHHCVGFLFFAWIPPLSSVRRRAASLTHSCTHSLTRSLARSLTHARTHARTHSLTVQIASWLPFA